MTWPNRILVSVLATSALHSPAHGFLQGVPRASFARQQLWQSTSSHQPSHQYSTRLHSTLEEIPTMRISELKSELESYGISTRSFLEKKELVEALVQARTEGRTKQTTTTSSSSSTTSSSSSSSSSSSTESSSSREDKIAEEISKIESMKAADIRQELKSDYPGISTKVFLEKKEFVNALAEARVDGVGKASSSSEEGYAEYADVEVLPMDGPGPKPKSKEVSNTANNGAADSNPFGGGGGGMGGLEDMMKNMGGMGGGGGMGGMGGMADMLKNMGGMGGGGGMGGMEDMMKNMGGMGNMGAKAQEMMKNPKVMEIITKAQSNPKVRNAVMECMGNPAALAKYQNDPEIAEVINELKKYI